MNSLKMIINEAESSIDKKVDLARKIIKSYTNNDAKYKDAIKRIAGYTKGGISSKLNPNAPSDINIIPIITALVDNNLVHKINGGKYKHGPALSKLFQQEINYEAANQPTGRLKFSQTTNTENLRNSSTIDDKIQSAPKDYKTGGKYSASMTEEILNAFKNDDPTYNTLSSSDKQMIDKMNRLSNPQYSFTVLKSILALRAKKKGYTNFTNLVKDTFKDEEYVNALYELEDIGVINSKEGTINTNAIKSIRNVMNYMEAPSPFENISNYVKVKTFLPKFMQNATASSASYHRNLNNIVTNPTFNNIINIIMNKLTPDKFDDIIETSDEELADKPNSLLIKRIASAFKETDLDSLKDQILIKKNNRENYKSEENINAKETGRMDSFINKFTI